MNAMTRSALWRTLLAASLLFLVVEGCKDRNDNPAPPDITAGGSNTTGATSPTAGDTGDNGGSSTGNTGNTGNTGDGGNSPGDIGGAGNAGEGGSGAEPSQPVCDKPELGADGCFNCPENKKTVQWLNRCSDSDCEPFDNKARLPLLNEDGSLPDLP